MYFMILVYEILYCSGKLHHNQNDMSPTGHVATFYSDEDNKLTLEANFSIKIRSRTALHALFTRLDHKTSIETVAVRHMTTEWDSLI